MSNPVWYTRRMKNMKNIKLNKEEQEFIAENITNFDVVTEIEINDVEVRIHGEHFGGVGSAAIYRTNDMKVIWNHTTDKIKKIEKNLKPEVQESTQNIEGTVNYDNLWKVKGYYNDNEGNDIRCRD